MTEETPPPSAPTLTPEETAIYAAVQEAEVSEPALLKVREMVEQMNLDQDQADLLLRKFAELAVLQKYANMTTEEFCLAVDGARLNNKMAHEHDMPLPAKNDRGEGWGRVEKVPRKCRETKIIVPASRQDVKQAAGLSKLARKFRRQ